MSDQYDLVRKRAMSPLMKFGSALKISKLRSTTETLHLLKLAIRDNRPNLALFYTSNLKQKSVTKKKHAPSLNKSFIMALVNGMDQVVLHLMEKGFPKDVNTQSFGLVLAGDSIECPSYFMLAVSYGSIDVVSAMIKVFFFSKKFKKKIN